MLAVKINAAHNFTPVELVKLTNAAKLLERVVNSTEFKDRVLTYKFSSAAGLTNEQIYNLIMSGKEVLSPTEDHEIDIDIMMYYSIKGVIGYTYPNVLRTWVNRRFFKNFSSANIAGNLIHEWAHKVGFDHDFFNTKQRPYSVPYALGYLVEELGRVPMLEKIISFNAYLAQSYSPEEIAKMRAEVTEGMGHVPFSSPPV